MATIIVALMVLAVVSYVIALIAGLKYKQGEVSALCLLIALTMALASLALSLFNLVVS